MHRISCGLGGAGLGAIGAASTYACACEAPDIRAFNKRRSTSQQYTDDLLIRGTRQMREPGLQRHGNNEATVASALTLTPLVIANKRRAPVAVLSPTKRTAVIECFNNNGLHKGRGYWWGTPEGKAHLRCHCCRPRTRRDILCIHKSPTWFGTTDRTRPMVCTDADRTRKRSTGAKIVVAFGVYLQKGAGLALATHG
jgi:hypothetical protein